MTAEAFSLSVRNPTPSSRLSRGSRGSEPGATNTRQGRGSEPGATTKVDLRRLKVPAVCHGPCQQRKPLREAFPLLGEERARLWAIRLWCVECLVDRGHLPRSALHAYLDFLDSGRRQAARELALENHLVEKMHKRAADDKVFARALRRVARNLDT